MAATIQNILKPTKYRAVDTSSSYQHVSDNVITNGTFASDTAWTKGTGWTIGSGVATFSGSAYGPLLSQTTLTQGKTYKVSMTVSTGSCRVSIGGDGYDVIETGEFIINAADSSTSILIQPLASDVVVDNVEAYVVENFGNNNHGQIYSGRALEFDGVSDHLTFDTTGDLETFTIAQWVNSASFTTINSVFSGGHAGLYPCIKSGDPGYTYWYNGSGWMQGTNPLQLNTWYRLVYVFEKNGSAGNYTVYINGVKDIDETGVGTYTTGKFDEFGALNATDRLLDGMASDAQIWDVAWTQSDVTYDYLNPESLALNNSGTSLTESNLLRWFPMQDGHRGQQSYILDAANTGLGDSLVTNQAMVDSNGDGTPDGWYKGSELNSYDTATRMTYTVPEYGVLRCHDNLDHGADSDARGKGPVFKFTDYVDGTNYKLTFKVRCSENITGNQIYIRGAISSSATAIGFVSGTTEWVEHTFYFTDDGAADWDGGDAGISIYIGGGSNTLWHDNTSGAPSGVWMELKDVYVYPVNDKHHATTVFHGDNLITAANAVKLAADGSTADETDATTGWTNTTTSVFSTSGTYAHTGSKSIKFSPSGNGGRITTDLNDYLTVGRTYKVSIFARHGGSGDGAYIRLASNEGLTSDTTDLVGGGIMYNTVTTFTEYTATFVHSANTRYFGVKETGSNHNGTYYIDSFYVKEVGTATGWTDADQQIDIPQTALQSYNQLAWATDTSEAVEISNHSDFNFTTGSADKPFSISAWCVQAEDDTLHIFQQGGYGSSIHQWEYRLFISASQKIQLSLHDGATADGGARNDNANYVKWLTDSAVASKGEWFHVVATYNATKGASNGKIYINGEEVDTTYTETGTYGYMTNQGFSAMMFKGGTSGSYTGPGSLNEISIWDTALSAAEVAELYNDGKAIDCLLHSQYIDDPPELVAYWRNNGLATWTNLENPGTHDGTVSNFTETLLLPAGVDASRDNQGFLMNRQKDTNALNLPGSAGYGYVEIPEKTYDVDGTAHTFSFWVNFHSSLMADNSSDDTAIFGSDLNDGFRSIYFNAALTALKIEGDTNGHSAHVDFAGLSYDKWYNFAVVCDGSGNVQMYKDGETLGTMDDGDIDVDLTIKYIGKQKDTREMDGMIDDVLIYEGKALSAPEVLRNYNAGKRSHR